MVRHLPQFDAVRVVAVIDAPLLDLVRVPPAWTRLEPQSLTGDPRPGIAARIHDPLWLVGRQWQMAEFRGEDCGTPVSVRVTATTQGLTALRHGDADGAAAPRPLQPGAVFEPDLEAEPWAPASLRDRAEASLALIAALTALGWSAEDQLLADHPFDLSAPDLLAARPDAAWTRIAQSLPDAEQVAGALEGSDLPDWIDGDPAPVIAAARDWLGWYRANVSAPARIADAWQPKRLEYRFGLQAGTGPSARLLEAPCHLGGPVDWYGVDLAPGAGLGVDAGAAGATLTHDTHVHATPLRYAGMPATRMWQFEDGQVNFGVTDVQPHDLARLAFLEYATIHGNDWLIAAIDLPRGTLVRITAVSYATTFGERVAVAPATDQGRKGRFSMYGTDGPKGVEACFMLPPDQGGPLEGAAREEVVFARDETANVVWAIERSITGADGLARDRAAEAALPAAHARPQGDAHFAWTLESRPPDHWIPMVPHPVTGPGGFVLRKASFDGTDHARGRILAPLPCDLHDEEVPRDGIRVRRIPALLRDDRGVLRRWTARRVSGGWGESGSRLAYDVVEGPTI